MCLTCSDNRIEPPLCSCPKGTFEDFVSPSCLGNNSLYIILLDLAYEPMIITDYLYLNCLNGPKKTVEFANTYTDIPKIAVFF
jgi:hypothetical protein